ncbi:hypothetical protein [Lacipirellula parvula]|uniref:Uncharacterized protein n=1 Tax=Lacipirellula parvula TaxID=2650471 RepID=A0A5K7XHN7_9BACT|nr:hypothetical protein [Lacipirellula parvula]BBO35968.1 hypothetical protein PLANPX_5580 [Lacipirellula parvula]
MSHDPPTTGYDSLGDSAGIVKWPVLAQLPWVGDEPLPIAASSAPTDILPFVDSTPRPYAPPVLAADDVAMEYAPLPKLRIVDPNLPQGEPYVEAAAPNRRLHPATPRNEAVAEPPHIALHRMPTEPASDAWAPERPLYATEMRATEMPMLDRRQRPASEPELPTLRPAAPKQHRRFDPPQPRRAEEFAFQHRNDSFAAQFYEWHTSRKPQVGLIAVSALLLVAGGICVATFGRSKSAPQETIADVPTPVIEARPLSVAPISTAVPSASTPNETFAAPLPTTPALDLSPKPEVNGVAPAPAAEAQQPATNSAEAEAAADPIAKYLNSHPIGQAAPQVPPVAETQPHVTAKIVQPTPEVQSQPAAVVPPVVTAPVQPHVFAPIATPAASSLSPYPTTPYPPLDFSLVAPQQNGAAPAVAGSLGPAFNPPQPPR